LTENYKPWSKRNQLKRDHVISPRTADVVHILAIQDALGDTAQSGIGAVQLCNIRKLTKLLSMPAHIAPKKQPRSNQNANFPKTVNVAYQTVELFVQLGIAQKLIYVVPTKSIKQLSKLLILPVNYAMQRHT